MPYINDQCAVIASSDLSHYQCNAVARDIDDATIRTILSGNAEGALDACGETPIRIIMHVAKKLGLKAVLVDKRTSFDIAPEFGDEERVVGYAAIEFVKK
jgi:AmmeMemoRadiSam system protein B